MNDTTDILKLAGLERANLEAARNRLADMVGLLDSLLAGKVNAKPTKTTPARRDLNGAFRAALRHIGKGKKGHTITKPELRQAIIDAGHGAAIEVPEGSAYDPLSDTISRMRERKLIKKTKEQSGATPAIYTFTQDMEAA